MVWRGGGQIYKNVLNPLPFHLSEHITASASALLEVKLTYAQKSNYPAPPFKKILGRDKIDDFNVCSETPCTSDKCRLSHKKRVETDT